MGPEGELQLVTAISAVAGGLLLIVRRIAVPSGWLLLLTAATIPFVHAPPSSAPVPFTLSLVLDGAAPALAATAGVLWPVSRTTRIDRAAVALALGCAVILGGLAPALLYDPAGGGCNACARNLLEMYPAAAQADWLNRMAAASALVWGLALLLIALRRLRTASWLARRHAWPLAAGAGIAVLAAVAAGHGLSLPTGEADPVQRRIWMLQAALVVVICAGAVTRVYLAGTAGRRMARIVLAAIPDPAVVVGSLRDAVADPGLEVQYVRADGSLIDAHGAAAAVPDGPSLALSRDQQVFARLHHDPRLAGSVDLLRSSAASAGLALEYLAAQARLRAELRDAAGVRSRIVAAGSAERRRLERNLHDGAQQRLVALGLMLTAAQATTGLSLEAEHAEIDRALEELRAVARGLFPASLQESGVEAALRELGDHTICPLVLSGGIDEPVPLAVGMAVYQLVSEIARVHPGAAALRVELAGGGAAATQVTLSTAIADPDDVQARVVHAEDRFVAAGGRVTLRPGDGGTVVHAEAPCAS